MQYKVHYSQFLSNILVNMSLNIMNLPEGRERKKMTLGIHKVHNKEEFHKEKLPFSVWSVPNLEDGEE